MLRSIFLWCLAFVLAVAVALAIAHLIGFGSHCFVALAIALVLQTWVFRSRWIAKYINQNTKPPLTKEKKRDQSGILRLGPFDPAIPLATIPADTYFVEPQHNQYLPSNKNDLHNYEVSAWFHMVRASAFLYSVAIGMTWFLVYMMLSDDRGLGNQFGWFFIIPFFLFGSAWLTRELRPSWIEFSQIGAFRKMLRLNRVRRIREHGIPLAGQVVWFTRSNVPTRPDVFILILKYVFVSASGHQRMGTVIYKKARGYPPPKPSTPLVVIYVDDDCHMPL